MRAHLAAGLTSITADDVPALTAGASLLGSGGGGLVAVVDALLRHRLGRVPVIAAADLPTDALVVHVGVVGSPDVHDERLINPADLAAAARAVVEHLSGELAAVGIIEIGGMNGPAAVVGALELGVPVVDGDLMGRAFPSIEMTTLAVAGHAAAPLALVSPNGDTVVVTRASPRMTLSVMNGTVRAMGGAAALALYPTTAGTLVESGVAGSLSTCVQLGRALLGARGSDAHTIVDALGGRLLAEGTVDDIHVRTDRAPGSITLSLLDGSVARIDHLDEILAVSHDGRMLASTPAVLNALDASTLLPVRLDQIRAGQVMVVFMLPALHSWPPGAVDPAAFGLDLESAP
ncbi:DUF917 domain-containing protein [Nocardioides sp. WS12]|uniref:DUF917 domain-containing protein n=1 Tax=Nocardioides sp. WS12 TaxID=2486272 RepID=UPI0015FC9C3B|nr:DUF917 domain-containing protein [Nocardioides sp. WS12]